jgi:hypothetical protein
VAKLVCQNDEFASSLENTTAFASLDWTYTIALYPDAKPFALSVPRRVPLPLMDKVKAELTRMEKLGVISRIDEPTEWCAGMVVVPKSSGQVRICIDFTKLNISLAP